MSVRALRYENFDQAPPASIGRPTKGVLGLVPECEARPLEEIEIARREGLEVGHAQGFAEGQQAALEAAEARLARDLPDLLASLGGAAAEVERVKRACERDALLLAGAALRQMLPMIAERGLGQEVAALVAEIIANVPTPTIEVRASPCTLQAIERRGGRLPPDVTLVTDPAVPEGDVRCAWAGGEACFNGAAVRDAILAILDRCLGPMDPTCSSSGVL